METLVRCLVHIPSYNPNTSRLCLCPGQSFQVVLKSGIRTASETSSLSITAMRGVEIATTQLKWWWMMRNYVPVIRWTDRHKVLDVDGVIAQQS